jgi:hypothetical protein
VTEIRWAKLDEDDFNRLVETLIVKSDTTGGLRAQAIDGRGGDGGIDIDVRVEATGQLTHIYQLKHFPEGFSNGFKHRRRQIADSFEKAMAESPPVWTLVVPRNPTVAERRSVFAMRQGRRVRIRIMGPAELDELLSRYPEIDAYFQRDHAIEALRAVNRPEAALAKPGDLAAELARLAAGLDRRSLYWATSFHTDPDGTIVETLQPKRPDASEREPLSMSLRARFGPDYKDLQHEFEDKLKYGGSGTVVLPPQVIAELRREGPEWFAETTTGGELHVTSVGDRRTRPVVVESIDPAGRTTARLAGVTELVDRGSGGATVETALDGGLRLVWRFSDDAAEGGALTFSADPIEATPREVRRAIRLVQAMKAGTRLRLVIDNGPAIEVGLAEDLSLGIEAGFVEFIEDLCTIDDHFDVGLRLPAAGIDKSDRLWARVLVRMLNGEPTPMPMADTFSGTLNGQPSEGLDHSLRNGAAICISHPDWSLELLGHKLQMGLVYVYSGRVHIDDAAEILRALEEGTAADRTVTLRPDNGEPFLIYAPRRLKDGAGTVLAYPWDLSGIPEHSGFLALPNAAPLPLSGMSADRHAVE